MTRLAGALLSSLGALLALAPCAAGHGFFVDDDAPPGGDCQSVETACETIAQGLLLPDPDPGSPDFIVVEPGTYHENVVLDDPFGRSILASSTSTPGTHVIEPSAPGDPTVEISGPSDVVGFVIGGQRPAVVNGSGRLLLNTFSSSAVPDGEAHVTLGPGGGASGLERNTFSDDGTGTQTGVEILPGVTGSPLLTGNRFTGLWRGVQAASASPRIENNVVAGPASPGSAGIEAGGTTSATLSSNLIHGYETGLSASSTTLTATGLTAVGNSAADIALTGAAALTLNSSIVESPIDLSGAGNSCVIEFSAGPGPGSCGAFQVSSASPGFADAGAGDYRLTPGSPLIDAGDPAAPPQAAVDLEGEPRAIAGTCGGPEVRDIGADEFAPDCSQPEPPDPPPPDPPDPARDTDPPETSIRKVKVDGDAVLVRFRSDEPGSTFECRLDGKPVRSCESPTRYRRLDAGRHTIRVTAVDAAGNADQQAARKRFRIAG